MRIWARSRAADPGSCAVAVGRGNGKSGRPHHREVVQVVSKINKTRHWLGFFGKPAGDMVPNEGQLVNDPVMTDQLQLGCTGKHDWIALL